jgi:hypothetical protein
VPAYTVFPDGSRGLTISLVVGTGGSPVLATLHVAPPSSDLITRTGVPIGASFPT